MLAYFIDSDIKSTCRRLFITGMNNDLLNLNQSRLLFEVKKAFTGCVYYIYLNCFPLIKLDWDYLESNLVCVLFLETVFPAGDCVSRGIVTLGKTVGSTNLGVEKANIIASRLIFAVPNNIVVKPRPKSQSPKAQPQPSQIQSKSVPKGLGLTLKSYTTPNHNPPNHKQNHEQNQDS